MNINTSYRSMMTNIIGPILNYFGFYINPEGIIQKKGTDVGITLSGKHLYVPTDGFDYFSVKDSPLLLPFNPFKIREHTLLLSKFFCSALSDHFRDEDDIPEYNSAGELIDIVTLIKRGPVTEDKLPATFNGVIYEIWSRGGEDKDILGRGIDFDGNDIRAIIMAMIDTLSRYTKLVEPNPDFNKVFRYVDKIELRKDEEIEIAKSKYSTTISAIDLSSDVMDNIELEENLIDIEDEDDLSEEEPNTPVVHNYDHYDVWDDVEFK